VGEPADWRTRRQRPGGLAHDLAIAGMQQDTVSYSSLMFVLPGRQPPYGPHHSLWPECSVSPAGPERRSRPGITGSDASDGPRLAVSKHVAAGGLPV
jgi:hypothetical protein